MTHVWRLRSEREKKDCRTNLCSIFFVLWQCQHIASLIKDVNLCCLASYDLPPLSPSHNLLRQELELMSDCATQLGGGVSMFEQGGHFLTVLCKHWKDWEVMCATIKPYCHPEEVWNLCEIVLKKVENGQQLSFVPTCLCGLWSMLCVKKHISRSRLSVTLDWIWVLIFQDGVEGQKASFLT